MSRLRRKFAWAAALAVGLFTTASSQADWIVGYPWGRSHNGSAYMTHGGDTMRATQPGSNGFKYNSGGSYSTVKMIVTASKPTMGAEAYCSAPTVRGSWPAFWFTTEGAWTGEVDIAERCTSVQSHPGKQDGHGRYAVCHGCPLGVATMAEASVSAMQSMLLPVRTPMVAAGPVKFPE